MTQAGVAVEGLSLTIGEFHLQRLTFALSRGEILVILGPNGAGKSVTLECIAGFHRPDGGRVLIGGRDVTALPPEERNVAFLVQNFGLFPHMTVEQNVAVALRTGAAPRAAGFPAGDVGAVLAHFGVGKLAQRTPQSLSPGEKQRVALARALAAQPDLFLFDEPFSALDARTRDDLREDLLSFLRELAIPAIFVTHDNTDATMLADKIVVLRQGVMMQAGSAADVFHRPANSFAAHIAGVENIVAGRLAEGGTFTIGGCQLKTAATALRGEVKASIRAEAVRILAPGAANAAGDNRLPARVTKVRVLGPLAIVDLDCGFPLKAYMMAHDAKDFAPGRSVEVAIAPDAIHVMAD